MPSEMPFHQMKPTFFKTQPDFRRWFEKHHDSSKELSVGFYKRDSGRPSITWPESVDEALCFGWIDGIRRSIDDISYTIRFTPRKPTSTWSVVNIKRAQVLIDQGLMTPAGVKAFQARKENKSGIYAYEQRTEKLPDPYERAFKKNKTAWAFFQAQPPWYRKTVGWWIVSAKKEETRLKRLARLIEESANGQTMRELNRKKTTK